MAGSAPSSTLETRFTASITQFESELRRLQRLNAAAANNVANAHRRAAQQSQSAWAQSNLGQTINKQFLGLGASLKQYAGILAGAFAGKEALQAADSYQRFTNSLAVAGLQGSALNQVQDQLYASAIKNGVALEPLGKLYGRAAQSAKELGASQKDLLQFTNGVTSALRVSGTSTEEASGALLQLAQLLGAGTVRAEEFNSVNEGARPILEAVARGSEKYGGSVAKLRAAVIDGKVSSKEFFAAFLQGSASLEAQAAKAPLTMAASMQNLMSALTRYIGEANETWAVTEKITYALKLLAENFDTMAESVAVIGAVYAATFIPALGRAAAGLAVTTVATVRSTVATVADTVALVQRTAAIYGVSTASAAGAVAARGLGAALAFFGGPVGIAIMAVGAAIAYLGVTSAKAAFETSALTSKIEAQYNANLEAEKAATKKRIETGNLTSAERTAAIQTAALTGEVSKLKDEYYLAAAAAKTLVLAQARADLDTAIDNKKKARVGFDQRIAEEEARARGSGVRGFDPMDRRAGIAPAPLTAQEKQAAKQRAFMTQEGQLWAKGVHNQSAAERIFQERRQAGLSEFAPAPTSSSGGGKTGKGGKGSKPHDNSDASAAAIEQAERAYRQSLTASAETQDQRHRFALANLKADHDEAIEDLDRRAKKGEITKVAAESAKALAEQTYQQNLANEATQHANVTADRQNQITQQHTDLLSEGLRQEAEQLELEASGTRDQRKRNQLERDALDKRQRADDEAFRVAQDLLAIQRTREGYEQDEVDRLRELAEKNRATTKRTEQGKLEQDQTKDKGRNPKEQLEDYASSFGSLNDQLSNIAKGGIDNLTNSLTEAIMGTKSLKEAFGEMAKAMIAQMIQMAVRFAIFEAIGMAIGVPGLGKAALGVSRNALGTNNFKGGLTTLNEAGPEMVWLPNGTQVVPNNILKNAFTSPRSTGSGTQVTNINTTVNADDAVLTSWVKQQIYQANAGAIAISNKTTQQTIAQKNRNNLSRGGR